MALDPFRFLSANRPGVLRAYENAASSIGRLDAAGALASSGIRELLVLRCMVTPLAASRDGMIALLRRDPEGTGPLSAYAEALRTGGARARGGVVPTVELLLDLLAVHALQDSRVILTTDATTESPATTALREIDELMRDAHVRTPPLLKAVVAAGALLAHSAEPRAALASLATSLLLCVGGATRDTWLTLPLTAEYAISTSPLGDDASWSEWIGHAFTELAREARTAELGLAAARERVEVDRTRVREAFGRAAYSALDLLDLLANDLITSVPDAARALGQTPPTAGAAVARLAELGIAGEVTGRARSRSFVYVGLVDALAPSPHRAALALA